MMIRAFILSTVLFSTNCTSNSKPDSLKSINIAADTISSIVSGDSLNRIVQGKLLFQIEAKNFFKAGSINDTGYGETSLKYLMPLAFYKDSLHFYVPDESRHALNVLDAAGRFSESIILPFKNFTFYKIERLHSYWYLLDNDKGLSVLDDQLRLKYEDEKTTDLHIDEGFNNVYFENRLNDERALLDQREVLKEPLKIDYLNCFVDNSILSGILYNQNNQYTVVKKNLHDGTQSEYLSFKMPCEQCFILPSFLDETRIISSTDKPSVKDQVTIINPTKLSVSHYLLEYPFKVNRLASDISASVSYSGYIYFYDRPSKILYSLCTDKNSIKVFSFDLTNLK